MDNTFYYFLFAGMVLMFIVMCASGRAYGVKLWKIAVIAVALMPSGYYGTKIMYHIETGYWGGRSLYGAVFLVPIAMFPVAKFLKMKYGELMDVCAPAGCVMFALLKVKCLIDGCCKGRLITMGNEQFSFPSQIVEGLVFLVIMAVLLIIVLRKKHVTQAYPLFMIIYGTARFFLNLFRETTPWIGPLPAGNFWSLISIAFGVIVLVIIKQKSNNSNLKHA